MAAYTTTDLPDGVRYHLPPVDRSPAAAIAPIFIGLILICVALFGPMGVTRGWNFGSTASIIGTLVGFLFGLPFLGMGLLFVAVGVFTAVGHMEVELRGQRLRGVWRIGALRFGRWVAVDEIKSFEIKRPEARRERSPSLRNPRLAAEREGKKDVIITYGDRPHLRELAADLSRRCGLAIPDKLLRDDEPPIEEEPDFDDTDDGGELHEEAVIERSTDVAGSAPAVTFEVPVQPAGSKAILTRNADGITIEFPKRGFQGGARSLLVFSIIWTSIVGVIVLFILTLSSSNKPTPVPATLFLGVFLLIGVGVLLGAISVAKRRAVIDVVSGAVLVTTQGLRGVKTWQCEPDILTDIRVGPSGTTVNDKPVLELQIHRSTGDHAGFLAWRDDDELRWAAAELRVAAGLSGKGGKKPSQRPQPPSRSYADS